MKKHIAALLLATALASPALAQSNPGWSFRTVPTPAMWAAAFSAKQDVLNYVPLNVAGGTMSGRLVTAPPSAAVAGFNLTCSTTVPASPANGDEWCTAAGLFVQINGVTVGPLANTVGPITFTGQITTQGLTTTQPGWYAQLAGDTTARVRVGLSSTDVPSLAFGPGNAVRDTFIERMGAGALRLGTADAAAPVAQTLSVQNVVAGTSNTAGANLTVNGSQGTGTGVGGSIIFQVAPAGSTGTSQNPLSPALTLNSAKLATFGGQIAIDGVTSTGATGTGNLVFGTGPAIVGGTLSGTFSGTPSFSGANFVTLANLAQDTTAWSLLGNPTSGTANYAPFTIGSLTNKTTPAGADLAMIQDSVGGGLKYSTITQMLGSITSGVPSINSLTGPLSLSGVGGVGVTSSGSTISIQNASGVARMWPASNQTISSSSPWLVADMYGNSLSSICSGTSTACLQEFINYTVQNGQFAEVDCQGTKQVSQQSGTVASGSNIITGLSSTASLAVGDFVTINGTNNTYLPSFTTITSVDSGTQIHVNNNATGSATVTLRFVNYLVYIQAASTINVPPVENWRFQAVGCNITFNSSVTGSGIQFDSMMATQFRWDGVIVYQPATASGGSAILFDPTNPVPEDGIITITSSKVFFSNPVGNSNANSVVGFNIGTGPITGNTFGFIEINGAVFGIEISGAQSGGAFQANTINAPNIHGQTTLGVLEGTGATNQADYALNNFNVSSQETSSADCFSTNGGPDTWIGSCTGAATGFVTNTGSSAQFFLTMSGVTAQTAGTTGHGYINGTAH